MNDRAGDVAICYLTQKPVDDCECPYGCEVCLEEECDEYFVAYSG